MLGGALAVAVGLMAPVMGDDATTIRHRVRKHESMETIAAAYGVTEGELRSWNRANSTPESGDVLDVRARLFPQRRQLRRVFVSKGDDWSSIAAAYEMTVEELKGWNRRFAKRKRPPRGANLVIWLPSGVRTYPVPALSQPLPEVDAVSGGESVGRPDRGRLRQGVRLPKSEHYSIRKPYQSYGTSVTVRNVQRALAGFRQETGFEAKISIGAMSRKSGRRLRPHKSHQSGRDVDVRLPAMPFLEGKKLEAHEVDWHATFAMIDAFVRTGEVGVIFLERKFFRRVRRAGMALGASDDRIRHVLRRVRHSKGHTGHIHVRFKCAPTSEDCKN